MGFTAEKQAVPIREGETFPTCIKSGKPFAVRACGTVAAA